MLIPPSTRPPGTSTTPWGLAVPLLLTSLLGGLLGGLLAGPVAGASAPTEFAQDAEALEHFETFVRPIFIEHCVKCHGGDKAKGGLRLDTAEGIRSGAYDEPIAVAGDLDASTIIEAVRYDDPLFAMPPSGKLPDKAIRALERWVELGAVVPETVHVDAGDLLPWNLVPPAELPDALRVEAQEDGRDWIDVALESRLDEAGVELSQRASNANWLRRVTFDLTGLPPTPSEWRAFQGTNGGLDERTAVVDRLLDSPAYAERQARHWLDLVRYAETRAHEFDYSIPNAFQYRDYVIRAFEADVPYDRFVTEMLAGDLVPEPRLDPTGTFDESILGTGAWFLGEEVHSPVDIRGDQSDRLAHQVEVFSKSVLAMGVACARCHDHKFDPISAEDYHALAGFALSTSARQVRFETNAHNGDVARDLRALHDEVQPAAKEAIAAALEAEAEGLMPWLEALAKGDALPKMDATASEFTASSVAALDARFGLQAGAALLPILIEDFEADSLAAAALGPWEVEGVAFLDRPMREADTTRQADLIPHGQGSVNSFAGHDHEQPGSHDAFTGTLTSRPFPAVRRYLHLLVNGGDDEAVRIEIVDVEADAVIGTVRGKRSSALTHARFDLSAAKDREIRVRFVDEYTGGWGHIGGDHLVLSNDPDPITLDMGRSVTAWHRLLDGAENDPRALERLIAWEPVLRGRAGQAASSRLAWLMAPPSEVKGTKAAQSESPRCLVDVGALTGPGWMTNGPGFGVGPVPASTITLDVEYADGRADTVIRSIARENSALAHPMWSDLSLRAGTAGSRGGSFNWTQGGRTLHTPTFRSDHGRIGYLVRGHARALLVVAGHKMVAGPLPRGVIKSIDTRGEWAWVEQRVPASAGLRAHLEFTATGEGTFEVAKVVDLAADGARPTLPAQSDWWRDSIESGDLDLGTAASRAAWLTQSMRDAAELLRTGGVSGKALSDGARASLLRLAEDLARDHQGIRHDIAGRLTEAGTRLAELRVRRALTSSLAPAAIETEGCDERILDRGSWRAPGAAAPRRGPSAIRASHEPLAQDGEGSGRLELAHSLLQSPTKIVQRVWVNRLWQAMFSVGIAGTPDDFGAMGAGPTHPEILDQLALDFEQDGWSTRRVLRRLALSDAYARSTEPTESSAELDPLNQLLSAMHVRRLEAEEIRDALLSVSGELVEERFGAPVPIHLTSFMKGRGRPGSSGPLDGAGRRSIYLEVRRNFLHPFLTVFDWPNPATCRGRRSSSNVPAQALTLLNDPFVEQCAEHLADRLLELPGDGADVDRLATLWLRVLGRLPRDEERTLWQDYLTQSADSKEAWVDVVHVLFNVKEFLFLK
ncbi:MAG: hypothetical protein ACI80K_001122 [Paracoccaceae bacterium]